MTEIFELPDIPDSKQDFLERCGFADEVENIKKNRCAICGKQVRYSDFKDQLSIKEYSISGMCQSCQDKAFSEEKTRCRVFLTFRGCIEVLVPEDIPIETKKILAHQKALAGLRVTYNSARDAVLFGEGNKNLNTFMEQGDIPGDVAHDLWERSEVPDKEEFISDAHSEGIAILDDNGKVDERHY